MSTGEVLRFDAGALRTWAVAAFAKVGMPPGDAGRLSDALVQTSLWGVDSHGIARLPHYLERLTRGSIRARPAMRIVHSGPATAQLHGDQGQGIVVAFRANDEAIALARAQGIAAVGVSDSSHCGAMALYTREAARQGLIGIAFTHADRIAAPQRGHVAFLGTNPISIAVPRASAEPVCLDMATTSIPWNRVINARREGQRLPEGVALDADGRPTTDAQQAQALVPLGGTEYGHKGYALALLIDLLCGPLNGNPFGPQISGMFSELDAPRRLGALFIVIDPARFAGGPSLPATVEAMAQRLAAEPGAPLMPGDPELERQRERRVEGIPVEPGLLAQFESWSARLALALPPASGLPQAAAQDASAQDAGASPSTISCAPDAPHALDVITLGESMAMLVADSSGPLRDVGHFTRMLAGAETNVAIGLARLGHRVAWLSRLGTDSFGDFVLDSVSQEGVDVSRVVRDATRGTGFMLKTRNDDGSDPATEYHRRGSAASALSSFDFDARWFAGARHLHLTGISPALSAGCSALVEKAMRWARANEVCVSFDPNLRPKLWPGEDAMRERLNELAALADFVLPGIAEGRLLTQRDTPRQIAEYYLERGARVVVIKLGAQGAWLATAEHQQLVPGFEVERVVDTVGAGDGFAAGFISGVLEGLDLPAACRRGNWVGAQAVQAVGDMEGLPRRSALPDGV